MKFDELLARGPLVDEDWALEAELRGVQRLLSSLKSRSTIVAEPAAVNDPPTGHRVAAGGIFTAAAVAPARAAPAGPSESMSSRVDPAHALVASSQSRGHAAAWGILSLGLAAFACGAVLLAWSLFAQRPDLWPIGLPLALIGQAGLIFGLIMQLDGLWQTSRKTAAALSELDYELTVARQAAASGANSAANGPAPAFTTIHRKPAAFTAQLAR